MEKRGGGLGARALSNPAAGAGPLFMLLSLPLSPRTPLLHPNPDLAIFTATANASIISLNLSLMLNAVGFYQVAKLLIIPFVCGVERAWFGRRFSRQVTAAVAVVVVGVAIVYVLGVAREGDRGGERARGERAVRGCVPLCPTLSNPHQHDTPDQSHSLFSPQHRLRPDHGRRQPGGRRRRRHLGRLLRHAADPVPVPAAEARAERQRAAVQHGARPGGLTPAPGPLAGRTHRRGRVGVRLRLDAGRGPPAGPVLRGGGGRQRLPVRLPGPLLGGLLPGEVVGG